MDWSQLLADLKERGWTQQELAVRLGLSQSSVSALATGDTKNPAFKTGAALMEIHESGAAPDPAKAEG